MFDDKEPNSNIPPNLPVEPEDMFAGTEPKEDTDMVKDGKPDALSAGLLQKKNADVPPIVSENPLPIDNAPERGPILGKILLFILAAVLLGGVGFGGWWVYAKYFQNAPGKNFLPSADNEPKVVNDAEQKNEAPAVNATTSETAQPTPTEATSSNPAIQMRNDEILFGATLDSDKDGLDDIREKELGTDLDKMDTDGDGLNDGDEVTIWRTDPLNADSDGDGFNDGTEITNGFNPLGPGRLNVVSTSTEKTN